MNQFLREELAEILRELPLPEANPEIGTLLIKAAAILEVLRPAPHLAEAETMEHRAVNTALGFIDRAYRLATKNQG